jgi:hypothetical membrane protein
MTSIGISHHRAMPASASSGIIVRQALLFSGIVSSLLYLITDLLGAMWYPGYSLTSQAVSELMATGAPSERFVDPLFIIYGVLALAFGLGVFLAGGEKRELRISGLLLIAYAAVGFTGPTLFEMHPRSLAGTVSDTPHILLTGVLSLLLLLSIGLGGFALGKRFRIYTLATLLTAIAFGAMTAPYAVRLARHQPTPGFGIIERINIYATLAWVVVFALALLRLEAKKAPPG